ncbi:hypothetical protein IPM62_02680 [Candidatus Woesebacteria bacterium]|nr:MAG: hypothetical protein IPM62_02680 [Candidatus Woesebacteria bacterium]
MKNQSITVAISTRHGAVNLVKTAESIVKSINVDKFRFIVIADTLPIKDSHLKKLKALGIEVHEYKKSRSLSAKLKQIVTMTKSGILVFTQDDLLFDKHALAEISKVMEDKSVTEVSSRIVPFPAQTTLEKIIEIGVNGVYKAGKMWNDSDNYLVASGRCMAFKVSTLKKMKIVDGITNLDAYLYFENKRVGGKFKFAKNSIVYNKSPMVVNEHMRQSSRFQYSKDELEKYFGDLTTEYQVPLLIYLAAFASMFISHPIYSGLYLFLFVYTRVSKLNRKKILNPLWKVDSSTKKI